MSNLLRVLVFLFLAALTTVSVSAGTVMLNLGGTPVTIMATVAQDAAIARMVSSANHEANNHDLDVGREANGVLAQRGGNPDATRLCATYVNAVESVLSCLAEKPNCNTVICSDAPSLALADPAPRLLLESLQASSPSVAPRLIERATVAALFASSSISMVPVWITAACTTAGTCREVNPFMARLIGEGPVRAAAVKAGFSFVGHYAVWRMSATTKKEKAFRLGLAAALLVVNGFDAIHDVRVMRRLQQRTTQ